MVAGALARIGGLRELPVEPALGMEDPWRYRNKASFALEHRDGRWVWGYRAEGSHRLVPIEDCLLVPPRAADLARALCQVLDETGASASGLTVRLAASGETLALVDAADDRAPARLAPALAQAGAGSVLWRGPGGIQVLQGREYLTDTLGGLDFRVSADAFLQVNPRQTAVLYGQAAARAALTGRETVVDLYCGTGTIGLSLAKMAGQVVGVEIIASAAENAAENARLNGIGNARFICGDAGAAFARLVDEGMTPDLVIVDPPRRGCDPSLPGTIAQARCPRVLYISCDPATLARDLARFAALGYAPGSVQPVDMFPQTEHVECVVLMSRVDK
jgi:23S rRNA (uracil1939-C5)-methyltransferase